MKAGLISYNYLGLSVWKPSQLSVFCSDIYEKSDHNVFIRFE